MNWIGSIGVININELGVKSIDAKIMGVRLKIVYATDKTKHAIQFFFSISSNATDVK